MASLVLKSVCVLCLMLLLIPAMAAEKSTLDGYDRAKVADANYEKMHGSEPMAEAEADPELAATMKKYIYGDLSRQIKLTDTERQLVTVVVLATNQNHKLLKRVVEGALALEVTPLQIREALYHVAPYIGFPKVFEALDVANAVFKAKGIKLPLENQGTTTDANRFEKGLAFQVGAYGDVITQMRVNTPDYQKHLQDDLSAFCFGDTYTRGTLDMKMREMLTMAVIGTLGTAEAQYKSHVAGTLSAGATNEEVIGVITTMNPYIGFPRTLNALRIANEVFNERKK
ncbi:MAG: carboxymuconolactone decarboxylase family protein [Synergistaceae bacterium]|nr:carboxymuconolactone decarboxylase family protein [Synergistaceae bacterium]